MKRAAAAIAASILVLFFWTGMLRAKTNQRGLSGMPRRRQPHQRRQRQACEFVCRSSQKFKASMHGSMFTCVDCHTDVKTSPHEKTPAKISCATCHADQQAAYDRSLHAKAIRMVDKGAATCVTVMVARTNCCPVADPKSRTNHANIPATCGRCHNQPFIMKAGGKAPRRMFHTKEASMDRRLPTEWRRRRCVRTAMEAMKSWAPPTPNHRSSSSMFPRPAAPAIAR